MTPELLIQLILMAIGVGLIVLTIGVWLFRHRRDGAGGAAGFTVPDGWTDDMRIDLPAGRTVDEVVDLVLGNALRGVADDETERQLVAQFRLSADDAAVARDRVFGGVIRGALTVAGNPHNDPDPQKDPLAFASFQRVRRDPTIAARIYPHFAGAAGGKA